jgi:hypothetical protein
MWLSWKVDRNLNATYVLEQTVVDERQTESVKATAIEL